MSTFDSLKAAFDITDMVVQSYLGDMEDADLLTRPGAGCNHIAWQLGHVISSEANMINMLQENAAIDLPAGIWRPARKRHGDRGRSGKILQQVGVYGSVPKNAGKYFGGSKWPERGAAPGGSPRAISRFLPNCRIHGNVDGNAPNDARGAIRTRPPIAGQTNRDLTSPHGIAPDYCHTLIRCGLAFAF